MEYKMSLSSIKLGEVAEIFSGFAFKASNLTNNGIAVIKIANIQNKKVLRECSTYLPEELFSEKLEKYYLEKDDFLIAMTGAGSVGKVGKMRGMGKKYLVNQRVGIVRVDNKKADPEFIYQLFSQDNYEDYMYGLGLGAGQPNISPSNISGIEISVPDILSQQKIASILSAYDDLIENNTRRIKILEEMAQTIYKEWFINFRFPGHEKVKFVDSSLGKIPEGWEITELQIFGEIITGKTPSTKIAEYYGDEIPFIKTPDMHSNIFIINTNQYLSKEGAESQRKKYLPPNSICISCIGTVGVVSITSELSQTNQQINSIILKDSNYLEYLYFICVGLKETLIAYGINGATMANVNKEKFSKMKVLKPNQDLIYVFHKIANPMLEEIKNLLF